MINHMHIIVLHRRRNRNAIQLAQRRRDDLEFHQGQILTDAAPRTLGEGLEQISHGVGTAVGLNPAIGIE